jgi:hypothetical protein
MPALRLLHLSSLLLLFVAVVTASGCGSPSSTASVTGTVTINGKPLTSGVVLSFVGADNVPRSVQTDSQGAFQLSNLPVGEVRVMVCSAAVDLDTVRSGPGRKGDGKSTAIPRNQPVKSSVPSSYSNAAKPLLHYTLSAGNTPLDIDLNATAK